jgi:DNA-binding transcriptional MerR regulator
LTFHLLEGVYFAGVDQMKIQEFAQLTGLSTKTIRYYESIGILPSPSRTPNGYRDYSEKDLERARFVAGIRSLDLSLDEVAEILAMRDRREAPCRILLHRIEQKTRNANLGNALSRIGYL